MTGHRLKSTSTNEINPSTKLRHFNKSKILILCVTNEIIDQQQEQHRSIQNKKQNLSALLQRAWDSPTNHSSAINTIQHHRQLKWNLFIFFQRILS